MKSKEQKEIDFMHLMCVLLWRYLDPKIATTNVEFERYLYQSVPALLTEQDVKDSIKHFQSQIYPLGKEQVRWMFNNIKRENYFYYDIAQQIKKLKL